MIQLFSEVGESLMTQTLVLFVIRTAKNPLQSRPSSLLIVTCLAAVGVGIYLPFSSFASALGFTTMPWVTLRISLLRRWSIS